MFELLRVFYCRARENFRFPVHGDVALFLMLRDTRVGPFFLFNSFFVFRGTCVDGAFSFSYVDRCGFTRAVEFVNPFAFAWVGPAFVFSAKKVLKFVAAFVVEVATSFGKSFF